MPARPCSPSRFTSIRSSAAISNTKDPRRCLCADSASADDVATLMDGKKANLAFTSPLYASQRKYDGESEFKPIPPEEYVAWFSANRRADPLDPDR